MTVIDIEPCLDEYRGGCEGEVEYRIPMSPTGKWFPRCEKHFDDRVKEQERISKTYGTRMFYW
jgi:hypothetical protein